MQAFGHEAQSLEAFDEVNGRLQNVSPKAIFFSSMTNPATRFVNNIVYAGVGLVGAIYHRSRRHHHRPAEHLPELRQPVHQALQRNFRRRDRAAERSGLRSPRVRAAGRRRPDPRSGERRKARAGRPRPDRGRLLPLSARPPAHRGACLWTSSPASASPSSAPPAAARPPSSICSCGSMMSTAAPSKSPAPTSGT